MPSVLLLTIVAAVLAFVAGYQIAGLDSEPQEPPSRSYTPTADLKLDGDASEVRAILLDENLLRRTAHLTALLEKLGPTAVEDLKAAYRTIFMDYGDTDLIFFAEWWARFDPAAAFAWTQEQMPTEHPLVVTAVLRTWARTNPTAALVAAQVPNPTLRNMFMEACLVGWAESGRPGLFEFIQTLPEGGDRQRAIQVVARRKVLRDGPKAAFEWAEALPDDAAGFKLHVLRRVASSAAEVDPGRAARWAEGLLGGDSGRGITQRVGTRWAKRDPRAAMQWLSSLAPGRDRDDGVRETFRRWMREDPDAALHYGTTVELEPWLDPVVVRVAHRLGRDDPRQGLAWASKVADKDLRLTTIGLVARGWAMADEAAARRWVEQAADLPDYLKRKIFNVPDSMQPGIFEKKRQEARAAVSGASQGAR